MNNKKPRRINYRVNYCSSEDNQYPVSELVLQSAESKGWQTKRFATFPQTVIIELLQLTLVTNLSFLSHQNKICTKIQIQGKEDHEQNWSRLGYTTLQSGTNTNYQSRELRNISIGGKLILLLKFTFHQNYANHINIFNQVGIIALLVYGQKATVERQMVRSKQGEVIANLYELDKETIMKLKNLQQSKKQATDNDDFEAAKDLKNQIENLQANLKALIILQKQKKQAIRREEYDTAKQITERMKRLRGPMFYLPKNNQVQQQSNNNFKYNDFTPKKRLKNSSHSSMNNYEDPERYNEHDKFYQAPSRNSERRANESFDLNQNYNLKKNKSNIVPFDQIVINPKQKYPVDQQLNSVNYLSPKNLPPRYKNSKRPSINQKQENDIDNVLPNISSVKKLQKLNPVQFDECSRFFSIFNEVTFEHIYSKQHLHRQKGLKIVNETLDNFNMQDKKLINQFVTASLFIVNKLINDKIISVLIANIDFFGLMMKKLRPNSISSTSKFIQSILTHLADYLGHSNEKYRQTCEDVFSSLPAHELTNKDLCFEILCKNTKDKRPKIIVGRLNTLSRIVFKFGADKAMDQLIDFGKRFLEDKNSDVRIAATNFMVQLSKQIGYQNLYPQIENMKPFVIKMIQQRIQSQGGIIQKIPIKNKNIPKPELVIKKTNKLPTNPEYYCDFCKQFDKRFEDDNFRDKHLYSDCLMIILCPQCKQAIQISNLNNHLLSQCQNHKYYKKCPKCKEAVAVKQYNQHTKIKECNSSKPLSVANRCPLCHEDIQSGQTGWIKHLAHQKCPQNPKN